jgi:hypothetical protein
VFFKVPGRATEEPYALAWIFVRAQYSIGSSVLNPWCSETRHDLFTPAENGFKAAGIC